MKRMNLAERQRMKAAERKAKLSGVSAPKPAPVEEMVDEEDAAELEYQEKAVKKKRTRRKKSDDQ
jgi:hypothetical protein